jgi:signal transduction histidine kinase/ActR/RegA family two-component response regulator
MARHPHDTIHLLVTPPEPPRTTDTAGLGAEEISATFSSGSSTLFVVGRDLRVLAFSGPAKAGVALYTPLLELIPAEHQAFYAQQLRRVLTGGETITFEALSRTRVDPQRWERVRLTPLDVGGDIRGVIAHIVDIEHERAIARHADRLRATFDYVDEGMLVVDLSSGNVIECNEAATRLLQVPADELNDTAPSWWMLEPAGMPRLGWGAVLDELCEGRTLRGRATLREGQEVSMELRASAKRLDDGHFAFVFCRDIQDELAQERARATQERLATVGSLAAGVAHEINNPLSYVIANVQFALEQLGAAAGPSVSPDEEARRDQLREALLEANEGARRVQRIVSDLKTLARQGEDRMEPIDVSHTLRWALGVIGAEIKHRARLRREISDLPPVRGDEARLGQVFVNLLLNAAQAIDAGDAANHEITVRAFAREGRVIVEVSDTGGGIADTHIERIFEPFFTTKPRGEGTGLGLSICHEIVTSMNGTLTAENRPTGGALFTLSLPALTQVHGSLVSSTRRPPPSLVSQPTERARVLVIDDETLAAKALARLLREHEVTIADHAPVGLAMALEGGFDAILCDLMMPELSGMALYRDIEARRPDIAARMIFITGGTFTDEARAFAARHAERCLFKPFDAPAVREQLRRVILGEADPSVSAC